VNNVTINSGNQVNNQGNKTKNTTVNNGNNQTNQSWKGQSTYNGGNKNNGNSANNASRNPPNTNSRPNSSSPASTQSVKPDRGYPSGSTASSAARSNSQPAAPARNPGAFEGAGNSGRAEKASSQRGGASTQGMRGGK
jgi:hypothetical protein